MTNAAAASTMAVIAGTGILLAITLASGERTSLHPQPVAAPPAALHPQPVAAPPADAAATERTTVPIPASPPVMAPPPVQVFENANPRPIDAVPTGGPYFAEKLRRQLGESGIEVARIRIRVTRREVILEGSVPSDHERTKAGAVVEENTPEQLTVENRLAVVAARRRGSR